MSALRPLLESRDLVPPLNDDEAELAAKDIAADTGLAVCARSISVRDGMVCFLSRRGQEKRLCVIATAPPREFEGEVSDCAHGKLKVCAMNHENAEVLRRVFPYTVPSLVGGKVSFGMGDRLGIATPGHIRAIRGTGVMPILAQQSIREMTRTRRTPEQVMDDAAWGVMEEGYRDGFGADADHLKTIDDIDNTLAAGFRMFTIDPGEYVDNAAESDTVDMLRGKLGKVPWEALETTEDDCRRAFSAGKFQIGHDMALIYDEETILRAVVKYGRPVVHVVRLYRHLVEKAGADAIELEMSVDETDSPTTVHEHFYVVGELKRLGVKITSLAPRFIGDFEKGIDYKGDLKAFEQSFIQHVQLARYLGPYKISIHSGSDKFSIYPIAAEHAGELIHVKTAGTSYLEALRAIAVVEPDLFREIMAYAFERYDEDKASYHVSADMNVVPAPDSLADDQLGSVLDLDDGRQLLHVTYGSVLNAVDGDGQLRFGERIMAALRVNEEPHYEILVHHLQRHIRPFARNK